MRANGVEAAIARYRESGTNICAQLELHANGERELGGFTVPSIEERGFQNRSFMIKRSRF